MSNLYDTIIGLTTGAPTATDKSTLVQMFANELGWTPSYYHNPSSESDFVNIHLVVEHGLENSAILSFLKVPYASLSDAQRRDLLNVSYNNMVDWHIQIENQRITYIYNRFNPADNIVEEYSFRRDQYDQLRSDAFEKIIGKKPSPNIPSLDDALINTITLWKRNISAELNNSVSNESLSSLFNAIIFVRAIEDNYKRYNPAHSSKILLDAWNEYTGKANFTGVIDLALSKLSQVKIPNYLLDKKALKIFDSLGKQELSYLFNDFYSNRHSSFYSYDFSIMSKHALSRIYEKYSALLKVQDDNQLSLFASLPIEETNKAYGAIYTPQYIARFFARYLKENLAPAVFNKIKVAEPSIGSGIFIRSLLEIKCDPRQDGNTNEQIKNSFKDILGIDVDANACKAAELSLALLQLVLTNDFPEKLNIINSETIEYINKNKKIKGTYDAVLANPPFISTGTQSEALRSRITEYMEGFATGRVDTYLAFLKVGLDLLKPGGYGLFVIPHSFLIANSAELMRKTLQENAWIRCVADLSAIPVFGNTGIYVTLLIFQKKDDSNKTAPKATIIKCRDFVGKALQDAIRGYMRENDFYSVFEVQQKLFENKEWHILPHKEFQIQNKINQFPRLNAFLDIRQGFVTGADDVFIVEKKQIPKGEEEVYIPYLPDRQIDRYFPPKSSSKFVFFPFIEGEKIEEKEMKKNYPETWKYLLSHKKGLIAKKAFNNENWWRPLRTRQPEHILRSKIITPHLTIVPKFSIDSNGKFGISRSPYLISKESGVAGTEMLLYFLAVLNSTPCYWYISNHSHKYSRGYTMIEVNTLQNTPVPDPATVPVNVLKKLITLVQKRLKSVGVEAFQTEKEIDNIVCTLYKLSEEEKKVLGIE